MRILFLYPNVNKRAYKTTFHFGIAHMSSFLKENGYSTSMRYVYDLDPENLEAMIKEESPDMVGITSVSSQLPYAKEIIRTLKDACHAFWVIGGIHPTLKPECLKDTGADALIRGEGEYPMLELANTVESGKDHTKIRNVWVKKGNKIIKNPMRPLNNNLDKLPFPDRKIFDYQKIIDAHARADFMFSRGCPFNCTYCSNHAIAKLYPTGNYLRHRSPENCIAEIKEVTSHYKNVNLVIIGNDSFNANKKWMYEVLAMYEKEIDIPFKCLLRPNLCDRETFKRLKDAGCYSTFMGIESGNDYIRNEVMNRNMTTQQIKNAFKWAHEFGIKTLASNIIGLPYETEDMLKDTIKLNAEIDPNFMGLGIFYPYEGTELGELCKEKGWIRDVDFSEFVEREDSILSTPAMSREKMVWYFNNFHYLVYMERGDVRRALYFKFLNYKIIIKIMRKTKRHIPLKMRRKLKKIIGGIDF